MAALICLNFDATRKAIGAIKPVFQHEVQNTQKTSFILLYSLLNVENSVSQVQFPCHTNNTKSSLVLL